MAATARMIWMCACGNYWPYSRVGTCASVLKLVVLATHLPFTPSPHTCPFPPPHSTALHPHATCLPFTPLPPTCPSPSSCPTALHPRATHLSFIPSHSIALHPFASQLPFSHSPPMHPTHPVEDADSETVYPVQPTHPFV